MPDARRGPKTWVGATTSLVVSNVATQARLQQTVLDMDDADDRVDLLLRRLADLMDHLGTAREGLN